MSLSNFINSSTPVSCGTLVCDSITTTTGSETASLTLPAQNPSPSGVTLKSVLYTNSSNQLCANVHNAGEKQLAQQTASASFTALTATTSLTTPSITTSSGDLSLNATGSNINCNSKNLTAVTSVNYGQTGSLSYYDDGSFTGQFTGIWASTQSVSVKYVRVGNAVTLQFDDVLATANTATFIQMSNLPTALKPTTANGIQRIITIQDNAVGATGLMQISISGNIVVRATLAGANFSGAGSSGFPATTFSYSI
jgi:hypothetical protein